MEKVTFFNRVGLWLEQALGFSLGSITVGKVLSILLQLAVCLTCIKLILRWLDRIFAKRDNAKTLHTFIRSAAKVLLLFLTVLILAEQLNIDVTSLITVMGVAGLAVSLALQDSLSKLVGGVMLLASKPFVVGDYIDAGANSGTVKEIGLVYTCLTTPDNKTVYLPNNDIAASRIVNYSGQDKRRVDVTVTASYDAGCETVKKALLEAAGQTAGVLQEPAPFAAVEDYGESSIRYVLRVWSATADYWPVYYGVIEKIRPAFDRYNIEMTYNHLNVHIKQD